MHKQNSLNSSQIPNLEKIALKIEAFELESSPLSITEVRFLIRQVTKKFKQEQTILFLSPPLKVVGDICGHYEQLTKIFETIGKPEHRNYLFLGNYTCKGRNSIQSLLTVMFYKIKHAETFFMLRGRFELAENNFMFGLYEECAKKYGKEIWLQLNEMFNYLPLGAVVDEQIYCTSSGLVQSIKNIHQMNSIVRNQQITQIPEIHQLLCAKPKLQKNCSVYFDDRKEFEQKVLQDWIRENNLSLVIRSNEVLQEGFEFSLNQTLLTICSIPDFLNVNNLGAVVNISEELIVSLQIINFRK